jgi:hypothetical protein
MIARWWVLLDFWVAVKASDTYPPREVQWDGYLIRIYRPYRSHIDHADLAFTSSVASSTINEQLLPDEFASPTDQLKVDGEPAVMADAIQIDFVRPEFDRRVGSSDPTDDLMLAVLTSVLSSLRMVVQAPQIRSPKRDSMMSRMTYLADDETELPPVEGLHRRRIRVSFAASYAGLTGPIWTAVGQQTLDYTPRRWDDLLLDARYLLPDFGPALVLANTALEICIADALDQLAQVRGVSDGLWKWINDRGDYRKEPSTAERYDILSKELGGMSRKERPVLWQGFQELRSARNAFAHEGTASIGGRVVDWAKAVMLLDTARQIVEWVDQLRVVTARPPTYEFDHKWELTMMIIAPER